jgi:hypothetical protein
VGRSFAGEIWRLVALAALIGAVAVEASTALSASRQAPPRVTMFGDSSAEVLDSVPDAQAFLGQGLDMNWQLRVCRRLVELSCPYEGVRPPTVLDVLHATPNAQLGSIVVIDVGYNDYVDQYQNDMETIMKTLVAKGVEHVIWTTMHEVRQDYRSINATIHSEATRWPQITIADWNAYSQGQQWFNSDGIHLDSAGAWGLAHLLRPLVLAACGDPCQPPPVAKAPPKSYVIRTTPSSIRIGSFSAWSSSGRGTYAQATSAFGQATSCRLAAGRKSKATWSSIDLVMQFIVAKGSICSPAGSMLVQTLSVAGPAWKTANGLAVGDPVAKLRRLYPGAAAASGSDVIFKIDRSTGHAQLSATVRGGKVAGFSLGVRTG